MCIASDFAFAAGVDYNARENYNMSLDNEFYAGNLREDEYYGSRWLEADLWPEGGCVAKPRMEGPVIRRPCANQVITLLPDVTLPLPEGLVKLRGQHHPAPRHNPAGWGHWRA